MIFFPPSCFFVFPLPFFHSLFLPFFPFPFPLLSFCSSFIPPHPRPSPHSHPLFAVIYIYIYICIYIIGSLTIQCYWNFFSIEKHFTAFLNLLMFLSIKVKRHFREKWLDIKCVPFLKTFFFFYFTKNVSSTWNKSRCMYCIILNLISLLCLILKGCTCGSNHLRTTRASYIKNTTKACGC